MLKRAILFFTILTIAVNANAIVFGGSNLDFMGYPEFKGYSPYPPNYIDNHSIQNYSYEVETLVNEAENYIENANYDIQRIQEAKAEAIKAANQAVEDYNRFIQNLKRSR